MAVTDVNPHLLFIAASPIERATDHQRSSNEAIVKTRYEVHERRGRRTVIFENPVHEHGTTCMEFGLTWAKLDEMEYVTEAEKLGFTHLWVTDSGLIRSDPFVFLTVAAQQTKTMKLGMGVAVPGLRLAPTLAAGMATLNMVVPGR